MKRIFIIPLVVLMLFTASIGVFASNNENTNSKANTVPQNNIQVYPFAHKGKWGYMDNNGVVIIEPKYDIAYNFSDGLALVGNIIERHNDWNKYLYGYIDDKGKVIIPIRYHRATSFENGNAVAMIYKDDYGDDFICYWFRPNGKSFLRITESHFDEVGLYVEPFSDGLAMIEVDGYMPYYGYIDRKANIAINMTYHGAHSFREGLAAVGTYKAEYFVNMKWGYINKKGTIIISQKFDAVGDFASGLAPVMVGNKWGYIDKQGNYKIPLTYQDARSYSDGLAAVQINGRWGFIDKDNKFVIRPQYRDVGDYVNGLIMVRNSKGNFMYYIDRDNNKIVPKI